MGAPRARETLPEEGGVAAESWRMRRGKMGREEGRLCGGKRECSKVKASSLQPVPEDPTWRSPCWTRVRGARSPLFVSQELLSF